MNRTTEVVDDVFGGARSTGLGDAAAEELQKAKAKLEKKENELEIAKQELKEMKKGKSTPDEIAKAEAAVAEAKVAEAEAKLTLAQLNGDQTDIEIARNDVFAAQKMREHLFDGAFLFSYSLFFDD